jgi:hypothetical protein
MFPSGNLRRLTDHNLRKNAEVNRAKKTFLKYGKIQKIPSDPDMNSECYHWGTPFFRNANSPGFYNFFTIGFNPGSPGQVSIFHRVFTTMFWSPPLARCWSHRSGWLVASGAGWSPPVLAGRLRCWLVAGHGLDRIDRQNGLESPLAGLGWLAGGLDRPEASKGDREAGRRQRRKGKGNG